MHHEEMCRQAARSLAGIHSVQVCGRIKESVLCVASSYTAILVLNAKQVILPWYFYGLTTKKRAG
jgi:hypothetical protein